MLDVGILKNKKVLYVEDDESIMEAFKSVLQKLFGEVFTAYNGEDGLEIFKKNPNVDFVITDIKMPKMDGLEMAKTIHEIDPAIPCILTTAHAEYDYYLKADAIGVYRYITKPLDIKKLVEALIQYDKIKEN
ncbi:MAG: response regulator [Campylobacterota bacterium]|nr:response regulator [Campylobacterota bacterium]